MKSITPSIIVTAASLALLMGLPQVQASADDPLIEEAKGLMQKFSSTLQTELKAAIERGGPVEAIGVCEQRAPEIAAELSAASGWEIGRVSLKPRNVELGTPDEWETAVLKDFEQRLAAGKPVETLVRAETVKSDAGDTFRLMKAAPTKDVCLACHGSAITEPVAQALTEHYPDDQARGYALGQIRGAFSLAKPLVK
ncbi:Protein of unknown function [Allochromatium warmingii]|uniref:Tll0287-like domain-containing protein n=1 Tax=Allochromatium warmingii TaxID=61595 RepID=A0A1H3E2F8_ALLWA|nr:DUF3365 domain-containing protein [Allochromatium warmingii]SDX72902.1 Protein of unknown function [Allochromatium warmingii]